MKFQQLAPTQAQSITTTGSKKGVNLRDNPQMINVDFAQAIENFQTLADGRLIKVKGLREYQDLGSSSAKLYKKWDDWLTVYSQGTTVYVLDSRDNSTTEVRNALNNSNVKGVRYGEYFFIGSKDSQLSRIEKRINFSNLVGTINVGDSVIDDITNNKIGTVIDIQSGYFVIKDTESLHPSTATTLRVGTATCDLDSFEYTSASISNAPEAAALSIIGTRLYAGADSTVYFSEVDNGTNPPFTDWATGTEADAAGTISFKRAGDVIAIAPLGQFIVVFQENGKFAFEHQTIDSNGTLKRVDISKVNRLDDGGSNAVINTPQGIFYFNEAGLWQLTTLGVENTPFTEQDVELSLLLGPEYFNKINLHAQPDIMYDAGSQTIFLSYANNSETNNEIIAYRTEFKSIAFIKNWSIQTFYVDGRDFYGTSSVNGNVFELFKGYEVDDLGIRSRYIQEIQTGDLTTRKDLLAIELGCNLSEDSDLKISFDIHDEDGRLVENIVQLDVNNSYNLIDLEGHYTQGFGGAWGGVEESSQLIPQILDSNVRIRNYQRLILKIEDFSKAPCEINYLRLKWREKSQIKKRKITKV